MARVIRADRTAPRIVPAVVADAASQAAAMLERARATAELRLQEAHEQGRALARAENAAELLRLAQQRDRLLAELEPQVVKLALALARRIVGEELAATPARIADMARPLLARLRRARQVTLRVHPDDRAALEARLAGLRASAELEAAVQLDVDPSLGRGDCVLISDAGVLDARIDTQVQALARALGVE